MHNSITSSADNNIDGSSSSDSNEHLDKYEKHKQRINKRLKTFSSILAIIFTFCSLGVYSTYMFKHSAETNLKTNQHELNEWRNQYSTAQEKIILVEQYYDLYNSIRSIPFLEHEPRISWIETLQSLSQELKVEEMSYYIGSLKKEVSEHFSESFDYVDLYNTEINVSFESANEVDTLRFINALNRANVGLFTPTACTLSRTERVLYSHLNYFKTECTLRWFIVKQIDNNSITAP